MITVAFFTFLWKIAFDIMDWILHPISNIKSSLFWKTCCFLMKIAIGLALYAAIFGICLLFVIVPLIIDLVKYIINLIKSKRTNSN